LNATISDRATFPRTPAAMVLVTLGIMGTLLFLVVPMGLVFFEAFRGGLRLFWNNINTPDDHDALGLSLLAAGVSLPVNLVFGLSASWLIARYKFSGRELLLTLSKVPLSLSAIVAGVCYVMLYGRRGWFGPWFSAHHIQIIFAVPGILLVTIFVSLPYLVNQLVPLMTEQGDEEEIAAHVLGAGGWAIFARVTLPKIRWALVYGLLLANARALGEFGAVSVVSGHIQGMTNTLPLQVELLYNDYNSAGAFAAAALLMLLALATLLLKSFLEFRFANPGGRIFPG
jgi:sulfate transport system permease protein